MPRPPRPGLALFGGIGSALRGRPARQLALFVIIASPIWARWRAGLSALRLLAVSRTDTERFARTMSSLRLRSGQALNAAKPSERSGLGRRGLICCDGRVLLPGHRPLCPASHHELEMHICYILYHQIGAMSREIPVRREEDRSESRETHSLGRISRGRCSYADSRTSAFLIFLLDVDRIRLVDYSLVSFEESILSSQPLAW